MAFSRDDSGILPFRPAATEPIQVWHSTTNCNGEPMTAIARKWPSGTGWCGRCPRAKCNADQDVCLLVVRRSVPEAAAADFGLSALEGLEPLDRHVPAAPGRRGAAPPVLTPAHRDL